MNTIKTITKAPTKENLADLLKATLYLTITVVVISFKFSWFIAKTVLKTVTLVFRGLTAALTKLDKAVA